MVALLVMEPNCAVLGSNRSNERFAIRSHRNAFLRGRAECQLLGLSTWKGLPPDMKLVILLCTEVNPFSIGRPRTCKARTVWTNDVHVAIVVEGNHAARQNVAATAHLDDEDPFAVGGEIGMMGHAPLAGGRVDVAALSAAFVGCNKDHVESLFNLREEQTLAAFDPCKRRGVGQQDVWLATENRHYPHVPWLEGSVRDVRAIRREGRT